MTARRDDLDDLCHHLHRAAQIAERLKHPTIKANALGRVLREAQTELARENRRLLDRGTP